MCELILAIRRRMFDSHADRQNPTPGLIYHDWMSAAEGAIEALVRCGLSDGLFRQASIADEAICATYWSIPEQERELAHVFFGLEVIQHEEFPNSLKIFHPPDHLRAACEQLAMRDDLVAIDGGFAWPLDRLTLFQRRYLHQGSPFP